MSKTQTMPLDQFVAFQRGFDLPKTQFSEGKYPVYGSTSIIGYHNEFKVKAPGVITGRSGTLGNFQYAKSDFWPHNTSLWVKDFKGNHPKFAYYLMRCLSFEDLNSGGAVPTLNRNVLKSFKVDVKDIELPKIPDFYYEISSVYGIITSIGGRSIDGVSYIRINGHNYDIKVSSSQEIKLIPFFKKNKMRLVLNKKMSTSDNQIKSADLESFEATENINFLDKIESVRNSDFDDKVFELFKNRYEDIE